MRMRAGKGPNAFGFDNQPLNREYALRVIKETHGFWMSLKSGKRKNTEEKALL